MRASSRTTKVLTWDLKVWFGVDPVNNDEMIVRRDEEQTRTLGGGHTKKTGRYA